MKKKAVLFSITLLFACAAIAGAIAGQTAYAETPGGGLYVCFNGVTAVYGDDGGFAVADEDGFYFFKNGAEKVSIPELTGSNALFGDVDGRFALCGGKVYAYTVDAPESGAFTPQEIIADESFVVRYAALSDSAIYCASADEIRKYDAAYATKVSFLQISAARTLPAWLRRAAKFIIPCRKTETTPTFTKPTANFSQLLSPTARSLAAVMRSTLLCATARRR